ncbi:MAG: DNA topoisomerase IB [Chryseobacterium sp.]|nr:MAG: DNA topoisomerase IB [Chryseobacterium sp.]
MQIELPEKTINVTAHTIKAALKNPVKSAQVVNLVYVKEGEKGIRRVKKGKSFTYTRNGKQIKNKVLLERIARLVIPPAWKDVWICDKENGHLQCTGIDVRGRKQYRYHPSWNVLRKQTKFYRMLQFGEGLEQLRKKLSRDLGKQGLNKQKVLAAIVATMDRTGIRVGNEMYEKMYGSYGLSTLEDRHIDIKGSQVSFSFVGKKGIHQKISLKSQRLAKIIRDCKEIPVKELFQYLDDEGKRHSIHSEDVNNYIKEISGGEFTSKDFRTWVGTVHCMESLIALGEFETKKQLKKNTIDALDKVAAFLGNTRTVCKSHYVHPMILTMYEEGGLKKFMKQRRTSGASASEARLLKLLKKS